MKINIYFLLIFSSLIMLNVTGCGSKELRTVSSSTTHQEMIEEIDPFRLGDEFAVLKQAPARPSTDDSVEIPEEKEISAQEKIDISDNGSNHEFIIQNSEKTNSDAETMGFRVQIGMFSDESDANNFAEQARTKIDEKVYVIYEAPFFRVRVGDFTTKKEAEQYLKFLRNNGYKNSWWIRTTIHTH